MNKPTKFETYLRKKNMPLIRLYEKMLERGASLSYQTLWNIYHGRTEPKISSMQKISATLKTNISSLFDI